MNINELKIEGTILDRRRKVSKSDIYKIISDFRAKKCRAKDLADKYHIDVCQIYRYNNYNKYLAQCRESSNKYREKLVNENRYSAINNRNVASTKLYKQKLINVKYDI